MPKRMGVNYARLLAEVLRLQRWAGGDAIDAARIFGLAHGFESAIEEEEERRIISRGTQDKAEDILEAVENGTQSPDGMQIKLRLLDEKINDVDFRLVMQLCQLQSRFLDGIQKIAEARGHKGLHVDGEESTWSGALHWMDLVDTTEGVEKKLHAVLSPCVPRVGELIEPEAGSAMVVTGVTYLVAKSFDAGGQSQFLLIPHVLLEAVGDESEDDDQADQQAPA